MRKKTAVKATRKLRSQDFTIGGALVSLTEEPGEKCKIAINHGILTQDNRENCNHPDYRRAQYIIRATYRMLEHDGYQVVGAVFRGAPGDDEFQRSDEGLADGVSGMIFYGDWHQGCHPAFKSVNYDAAHKVLVKLEKTICDLPTLLDHIRYLNEIDKEEHQNRDRACIAQHVDPILKIATEWLNTQGTHLTPEQIKQLSDYVIDKKLEAKHL